MRFAGARSLVAVALVAAVSGCAMSKGSAEKAIAAADSTLQTVASDAQAYVPDLYAAAGAKVAAAREAFDGGNYTDALAKAQEAATDAGGLGAAIAAKKDELMAVWKGMGDSLPGMVRAIETRVTELSRMRRLPAGITKEAVDAAKTAVSEMTTTWNRAMEAHTAGNLAEATSHGTTVKTKAAEVMAALRMK